VKPEFTDDQLRYHAAKAGWPANALAAELLRLRKELAEMEALSDLQHRRTVIADKAWQEEKGRPHTLPDLGDLICWLMDYRKAFLLSLGEEVLQLRAERVAWESTGDGALEDLAEIQAERVALRTAITAALRELGVPTISYPAPVANAVGILEAALEGVSDE